jgi:hypothetical protein
LIIQRINDGFGYNQSGVEYRKWEWFAVARFVHAGLLSPRIIGFVVERSLGFRHRARGEDHLIEDRNSGAGSGYIWG